MDGKRPHESRLGDSPVAQKRPRTSADEAPSGHQYERLKDTHFPASIDTLPHVLKVIDTMLMSLKEALKEAAATGQTSWLQSLLTKIKSNKTAAAALEAAAANGHTECVQLLLSILKYSEVKTVVKATILAAGNGHSETFLMLLKEIEPLLANNHVAGLDTILCKAAGDGELGIVRLIVSRATEGKYHNYIRKLATGSRALALAIRRRQTEMVELLFALETFEWDLVEAFASAVDTKQIGYAKRAFSAYANPTKMFVFLARGGHLPTVKYLFPLFQKKTKLMNTAFGTAAQHNRTDVIEFLFRVSTIEQQTLDKAIEDAAAGNGAATVLFLYNTGRISPQSIRKVFETTGSFAAIRRLFENERIPDNSIAAAFKKASGCGRNAYSHTKDSINIVKLLFKKKCISSDTFGEAYMIAHRRNCRAVVECLKR